MNEIKEEIVKAFGNKLRVRVCGLCFQNDKILLIKHQSLGRKGFFWSPPGGGIDFGESAETSLIREFQEETGLKVDIADFLFVHEFISPPLHAIELFFEVKIQSGIITLGKDPELNDGNQILEDINFFSREEIGDDPDIFHNILLEVSDFNSLKNMRGYYKYGNFKIPNRKKGN